MDITRVLNAEVLFRMFIGLLEFATAYFFNKNFFDRRDASRLKPIFTILLFAAAIACANIWRVPYVNTAIAALLFFLFIQVLFLGQWVRKVKLCIIFIGLSAISEIGLSLVVMYAMRFAQEHGVLLDEVYAPAIVSKFLLIVLVLALVRVFPKKFNLVQDGESPWLLVFPVLGVVNMYVFFYMQKSQNAAGSAMLQLIALGLMIPLSTLAPLLVYDSKLEKRRLESELKISEEREQANDVFSRAQQRSLEESRRMAHDYKNHLINLHGLYGRGSAEAEAYYDSLMDSLVTQGDSYSIEMGNKVVSNIVTRMRRQCAQKSIHFQLQVDCGDLSFLQMLDASSIFDNALDNAMQACKEMPTEARRFINLSILERAYFVVIQVKNSKCNRITEKDGILLSTKGPGRNHGLGIGNIRIAARKYGGDLVYEYDEDTFTLSVRLNKK